MSERGMDGDRVVVLGGTGSVGRALVASWPIAERRRLRVLLHRSRPDWLTAGDVETCAIDPTSVADLRRALDGATALIDLLRPTGDGWRLTAAARLSEAVDRTSVRRIVHVSSIDVYGVSRAPIVDADTAPEPASAYAREHLEAERLAEGRPVATTVARLGAVFGPGSQNLVAIADEVAVAPAWRLAARRALNGPRRLHLVSHDTVTQALTVLVDADDAPPRLVVTDDAAPENDFAHAQDLLTAALRRPDVSGTPVLPRAVLRAALAWRGQPAALAYRRFAPGLLDAWLPSAAAQFPARLRAYVAALATARLAAARLTAARLGATGSGA
ncbi:MAG: NAD(P)H-binding protein [Vicinamibacteraceae bacterium]